MYTILREWVSTAQATCMTGWLSAHHSH
jgi:hypothetical protein